MSSSSVSCAICMDVMDTKSHVSFAICGHIYHTSCIDKWLKISKSCPVCRRKILRTKPVFLNLVLDPKISDINSELINKSKQLEEAVKIRDEQEFTITLLEFKLNKALMSGNDELTQRERKNEELQSVVKCLQEENLRMKLELEMHRDQVADLANEMIKHETGMTESLSNNIDLTVPLTEHYRVQLKQISDLRSDIVNLSERLDQFRGLYVSANNNLQVKEHENKVLKIERDLLQERNSHLVRQITKFHQKKFVRTVRNKYQPRKRLLLRAIPSKCKTNLKGISKAKIIPKKISPTKKLQYSFGALVNKNLVIDA